MLFRSQFIGTIGLVMLKSGNIRIIKKILHRLCKLAHPDNILNYASSLFYEYPSYDQNNCTAKHYALLQGILSLNHMTNYQNVLLSQYMSAVASSSTLLFYKLLERVPYQLRIIVYKVALVEITNEKDILRYYRFLRKSKLDCMTKKIYTQRIMAELEIICPDLYGYARTKLFEYLA